MKSFGDTRSYEDIIRLPRPSSVRHAPMPRGNRAAQFMPFAALTGYEAAIREEARLTDRRLELDEDALATLNERLRRISDLLPDAPEVTVTWFVQDEKKAGGFYETRRGRVKRIEPVSGMLFLRDGSVMMLRDILSIDFVG